MRLPDWEQQRDEVGRLNIISALFGAADHVPAEHWGKDHYSLLLYCESIAVDRHGVIQLTKMRTNTMTHADLAWMPLNSTLSTLDQHGGFKYPTAVRPGVTVDDDHDDWDCLVDLRRAGLLTFDLIERGSADAKGEYVRVQLTEPGYAWAAAVREAIAKGAKLSELWLAAVIASAVREVLGA